MNSLRHAVWRKSARSGDTNGNCVEVADRLSTVVGVRDSKDPDGCVLTFSPDAWRAFIESAKEGAFDA